jgi:hypothetical protein
MQGPHEKELKSVNSDNPFQEWAFFPKPILVLII